MRSFQPPSPLEIRRQPDDSVDRVKFRLECFGTGISYLGIDIALPHSHRSNDNAQTRDFTIKAVSG